MTIRFAVLAAASAFVLAACNNNGIDNDLDRAAIGGVGGAAVGEIVSDDPLAGAAIGAAGGALADDF